MRIKVYILHKHERGWSISNHLLERRKDERLVWALKGRTLYSSLDEIIRDYGGSPIPVLRVEECDWDYLDRTRFVDPTELSEAKPLKEFIKLKGLQSGNLRPSDS